jgi:hypothetical protein
MKYFTEAWRERAKPNIHDEAWYQQAKAKTKQQIKQRKAIESRQKRQKEKQTSELFKRGILAIESQKFNSGENRQ